MSRQNNNGRTVSFVRRRRRRQLSSGQSTDFETRRDNHFFFINYLKMKFTSLTFTGLLAMGQSAFGLISMQTGPGIGSSYASSLMTDGAGNVYLVGSTYDPDVDKDNGSATSPYSEMSCFVLAWQMDDGAVWEERRVIGVDNVMDSCHGIGLINPQALALIGNSEAGGLYATSGNTMTGWASVINKESLAPQSGTQIQMSDVGDIPYPISVVSDGTGVYVIALTTTDSAQSEHYSRESAQTFPNWVQYEKYGSSFDMTVMKFQYNQNVDDLGIELGDPTLDRIWHKEFPFNAETDGRVPRVYLSGMIKKNNRLIVAGSTWGKGNGYGNARGDDEDGFITVIQPSTGELENESHNQRRIGSAADDLVTGICHNTNSQDDFFYLVGATDGDVGGFQQDSMTIVDGSRTAFIMKIDVNNLSTVWTLQLGAVKGNAVTETYALNCFVDQDIVYVAGDVVEGAAMVNGFSMQESQGGDDIWVSKIVDKGTSYDVEWVQQVGTDGKDHLARYGGIIVDWDRNPVVYGDTTGSIGRTRDASETTTDVFVTTLDRLYVEPAASPVAPPVAAPVGAPVAPPIAGDGVGVITETGVEGLQSGPSEGSIYAAGMVFDGKDEIYFVGNTYDPSIAQNGFTEKFEEANCFVASIDLDDWNNGLYAWDETKIYGSGGVLESCHGLGIIAPQTIVMAGNSEAGGLYANGPGIMSGFAATLDKNFFEMDSGIAFPMDDSQSIPYPMSIATDGSGAAYIMALTSTDDNLSPQSNTALNMDFPNWIEFEKYGSSYDMTVMKVEYSAQGFEDDNELQVAWKHEFPMDAETNGVIPRVYLGGLLIKEAVNERFLVVAGSTRGLGDGYGCAEGDDEDGFVTLFDLDNGELFEDQLNQKRIGSDKDDIIAGICDNPDDPESFYIVGATRGDMGGIQDGADVIPEDSLQAFIQKVKVKPLRAEWTLQMGAVNGNSATTAFALDCVASHGSVYVAGNVKDGAGMLQGTEVMDSKGGDDIWVTRIEDNGKKFNVAWFQQLGTPGDDQIARFGGIVADADGNAIVYGDTTGSMFRDRQVQPGLSDVFVMRLNKHEFAAPTKAPVENPAPVAPVPQPTPPPVRPPTQPPHEHVAIGVQYAGPLYAGGAAYDSSLDRTMITGATYAGGSSSNCFVATISMNSGDMLSREDFGNNPTDEACSAIAFSNYEDAAYLVGGTEQNGLLTTSTSLDPSAVQYGMILQVTDRSELTGYGFEDRAPVQYPVATVADPNGDYIYVASMASNDPDQTFNAAGDSFPDFTSGGNRKFGSMFYMVVERFSVQSPGPEEGRVIDRTIVRDWYKEFKFDGNDASKGGIIVSSMTMAGAGSQLVVTGSTRQSGGAFGTNDGTDEDGWIIKLDVKTGGLYSAPESARSSIRVDDASQDDDWISGVCVDRADPDSFYIVGATNEPSEGFPQGSLHAFIAKINLNGLTRVWRVHLKMSGAGGSPPEASAMGCAVAPDEDGGKVYVVGNIMGGAVMDDAEEGMSHGGDDIFAVQFDATNGDIEWVRQVGTSQQDRLATGNPITLDADGNAILFGNTRGSMYYYRSNSNSDTNDVFLLTMSKLDGSYKPILTQGGEEHSNPQDLIDTNVDVNSDDEQDKQADYVPDNIVALQTGPDVGPSYAGGMVYDRFANTIYVTGATYGSFSGPGIEATPASSCFFGSINLPRLQWRERETYGNRDVAEACSTLAMTKLGVTDHAIVVGSTEENGLLTALGSGSQATQYGFALDLANQGGKYELLGGASMDEGNVQYPLAVLAEDEQVWMVSMASKDTKVTADFEKVANTEYPNLTTGGIEKYGSKYTIVVEKHNMESSSQSSSGATVEEQTLELAWRKPFEAADLESVFVSGMLRVNDELVIVGSTRGSPGGELMDGLMAKVSTDDGSFVFDGPSGRSVAYFSAKTPRDDWIMNACPDPDDDGHFYIVGATKGAHDPAVAKDDEDLTVHAFMAKIDVTSLTAVWTKQYTVQHASGRTDKEAAAAALGCDVVAGESLMYVAGTVENGATIQTNGGTAQKSAGGDDIFVALVYTTDGTTKWMRQVGSNGDDRIARGGGIKVDENKNAVVYGDTNGSFFRSRVADSRPQDSDIFVMLFDFRDGKHLLPLIAPPLKTTTTDAPSEWYLKEEGKTAVFALAITAVVLLVVACICCVICKRRQRRKLDQQKTSIFTYLQQFDVEDIDLRKSPPGGWHGTYLNKLAYGINDGEASTANESNGAGNDTYETAPLTHSSVVTDSLFMDNAQKPTLGYEDQPYDDLKPRTYEDESGRIKARDII